VRQYSRILFFVVILACVFILRIAYLQFFTDKYALNAANTSVKVEYVIPQRGIIFDRKGKPLVGNQPSFEITFTQALMKSDFDTLSFCNLVRIDKNDFIQKIKALKKVKHYSPLNPITFMKDLGREEIASIQERIFSYPPFDIVARPQRVYEINTSGNILGYTNQVSNSYIKTDSTYYLPGDIAGITGVEKSYEKILRGTKGVKFVRKDIRLRTIGSYKDGKRDITVAPGKDITLTIDHDLQKTAENMLVGKHGAIVALDPSNGEILVQASAPTIDPNLFTGHEKTKNLYKLQNDTLYNNKPTFDRSVQAAYPPGSIFKLLTALAGMQMGVLDENTIYPCSNGFNYRGLKIKGHTGAYPLVHSIAISSNCYFTHAFISIINKYSKNPSKGIDEWKTIMKSFGLGEYLNNDLAVGSRGQIPSGSFYERRSKKKDWSSQITSNGSIFNGMGQGDVLLTPLQMANFGATIANKGWYITPHIVKLVDGKPNPDPRFYRKHKTLVETRFFNPILEGMKQVVLNGTAKWLISDDFTQLAKTGTAQVPQGVDNSIFLLIAPAENPKIVVAVVMEHAGFGASWAGPAATIVAEKYLMGEIRRTDLYEKMVNTSFMPEYKRQWDANMKRKGIRVEQEKPKIIQKKIKPKKDSVIELDNTMLKIIETKKVGISLDIN